MNHLQDKSKTLRRRAEKKASALGPEDPGTFSPEEIRRLVHALRVHQIELEMQNEELRLAQEAIEISRARYFDLYDLAPVAYLTLNEKGQIVEGNLTASTLLGVIRGALVREPLTRFILPADQDLFYRHRQQLFKTGDPQVFEIRLIKKDAAFFWARLEVAVVQNDDQGPMCRVIISDITDYKQAEIRERLENDVLNYLNRSEGTRDTIFDLLQMFQKSMGFEAVGLRLRQGDDFPYYQTSGFPDLFVEMERYLCLRDQEGKMVRNTKGTPVLACMCGNILTERTNPTLPFFTAGGSFWTNSTTKLLASTTGEDRQSPTRNRCNSQGYESVALIPLRYGDEIIGLLQFNDHRRDQFTIEMIRFFERLGASIGIALSRKRAKEALQQSLDELEQRVRERTRELSRVNERLGREIEVHQQTEKALRESEGRYRSLVESTEDSIYLVDERANYLFLNQRHRTRLGLPLSGKVKTTYRMFHSKKETTLFRKKIEEVVATGQSLTYEYQSRRDGKVFIRTLSPVIDNKKVEAVLVTSKDITPQKEAEKNALRLGQELARLGRLSTLGELTASLAHELNQPLTAILSNAQTARRLLGGGSPDFHQMHHDILDDIVADTKRASEIIQRLRTLVRREDPRMTPMDLQPLVKEVISILKSEAVIRWFTIEEKLDDTLPPVVGDKVQIQQVMLNLILNSAEALTGVVDPEQRKIVISTTKENEGQVRISIRDFGKGIEAHHFDHIFSPFFTTKETGMGMGLAICRTIIQTLGGKIWAENLPDRGAVVHFTLSSIQKDGD